MTVDEWTNGVRGILEGAASPQVSGAAPVDALAARMATLNLAAIQAMAAVDPLWWIGA